MPLPPIMLIIKEIKNDIKNDNPLPGDKKTKIIKDNTPRTLKKIKSRENFMKYQWAWTF